MNRTWGGSMCTAIGLRTPHLPPDSCCVQHPSGSFRWEQEGAAHPRHHAPVSPRVSPQQPSHGPLHPPLRPLPSHSSRSKLREQLIAPRGNGHRLLRGAHRHRLGRSRGPRTFQLTQRSPERKQRNTASFGCFYLSWHPPPRHTCVRIFQKILVDLVGSTLTHHPNGPKRSFHTTRPSSITISHNLSG